MALSVMDTPAKITIETEGEVSYCFEISNLYINRKENYDKCFRDTNQYVKRKNSTISISGDLISGHVIFDSELRPPEISIKKAPEKQNMFVTIWRYLCG